MKDAQEPFAQALESGATTPGWGGWYIVGDRTLRGTVGFYGDPDAQGAVMIGYGIVPECEGQGIASEALAGVLAWAAATGRVTRMRATTFERHWASIRVLEKNGFVC
jgi:RimJ/RimL family protein N-acetyltransferase